MIVERFGKLVEKTELAIDLEVEQQDKIEAKEAKEAKEQEAKEQGLVD